MKVLGHKVDLRQVGIDKYIVAGETDHITPWRGCLDSARLFGGKTEFVLCKSGHVQTLVCPPGNPKSRYRAAPLRAETADDWRRSAPEYVGTWWDHWARWLAARSGEMVSAPAVLGSPAYPPARAAPGRYVFE